MWYIIAAIIALLFFKNRNATASTNTPSQADQSGARKNELAKLSMLNQALPAGTLFTYGGGTYGTNPLFKLPVPAEYVPGRGWMPS